MVKRTLITILAIFTVSAVMAQAYRWTDENGVVHYSDKPTEGAEQVYLPQSNAGPRSYARPASRATEPAADDSADQTTPFSYDSVEVTAPAPEETLWNIGGVLNVNLNVQPALQPGHRVRVYFDGEAQMVTGSSFQLQEVYRGVHNIQAEVLDENGQLMARSQPNRFYVQQNSVVNN